MALALYVSPYRHRRDRRGSRIPATLERDAWTNPRRDELPCRIVALTGTRGSKPLNESIGPRGSPSISYQTRRPVIRALSGVLGGRRRRSGPPKSKRTSPPSSFSRASKGFPAFDWKPRSNGLTPRRSSAWAVRTPIALPAIVFQIANRQPCFQPLHPYD